MLVLLYITLHIMKLFTTVQQVEWTPVEIAAVVFFVLGILANVFIPYLLELQAAAEDPENHPGVLSWKYVLPKIIAVLVLIFTLPLTYPDLDTVLSLPWQTAFIAGYGVSAVGELVRKGIKVARQV